jgi:hypothetical protein
VLRATSSAANRAADTLNKGGKVKGKGCTSSPRKPVRSFIVRTWRIGPGTLLGGVKESRSSRWGSYADAESYRDSTVELNGGPDRCGSEILPSTNYPELVRHCVGHPCQAIGCTCFGCGRIVTPEYCRAGFVFGLFLSAEHSPDGRAKWAVTRDALEAHQRAAVPGWTVRRMTATAYDDPSAGGSWDAPTFYALADPLP